MRSAHIYLAATLSFLVLACGGPDDPSIDASASQPDAFTPALCAAHSECDNQRFCDGLERCVPGDAMADARGCVPGELPCGPTQTCDESIARCLSDCDTNPDADDDNDRSSNCGGYDCDDNDPEVHSGAVENCDAEGRDEDCNPATLAGPAQTDLDGDGYVSSMCCNIQETGALLCGLDCDDNNRAVHPAHPEVCDGIDNDCDGMIDENVHATFYRDADGDLYGDPSDSVEACVQPPGYVANADDCDDTSSTIYPGAPETCNAIDDDCDGSTDEAVTPAPATAEHCGGCNLACPTGFTCDGTMCIDGAVEVAAGQGFVVVRGQSGSVYTWGTRDDWSPTLTSVPGITNAIQISAANNTACVVESTGQVKCWGFDFFESLNEIPAAIPGITDAASVSVGHLHACVVSTSGGIRCWGQNMDGQLGTGDTGNRTVPAMVTGLSDAVTEVVAGFQHTCARTTTGAVYCWGAAGLLGDGTTTASPIPVAANITGASSLGGGGVTSCVGAANGARCWGHNLNGSAGAPPPTLAPTSVIDYPANAATLTRSVLGIAHGRHLGSGQPCTERAAHTCSISTASRLYCWGANDYGQLGDGTTTSRHSAGSVSGIPGNVTSIATGYDLTGFTACGQIPGGFTCATNTARGIYCWGTNLGGLLRTGDNINRHSPEPVVGFPIEVEPMASP